MIQKIPYIQFFVAILGFLIRVNFVLLVTSGDTTKPDHDEQRRTENEEKGEDKEEDVSVCRYLWLRNVSQVFGSKIDLFLAVGKLTLFCGYL